MGFWAVCAVACVQQRCRAKPPSVLILARQNSVARKRTHRAGCVVSCKWAKAGACAYPSYTPSDWEGGDWRDMRLVSIAVAASITHSIEQVTAVTVSITQSIEHVTAVMEIQTDASVPSGTREEGVTVLGSIARIVSTSISMSISHVTAVRERIAKSITQVTAVDVRIERRIEEETAVRRIEQMRSMNETAVSASFTAVITHVTAVEMSISTSIVHVTAVERVRRMHIMQVTAVYVSRHSNTVAGSSMTTGSATVRLRAGSSARCLSYASS